MIGRRFAHELEHLVGRLRPQDRLVGRGQRREHAMDPRGGAVAVEIVECEGNVLGHAFEQADGLLGQRMGLIEIEQQYADRIAVALDRNGRGRPRADLPRMGVPAPGPLIIEIVVTDKGAAGAERRRRQSLAVVGGLVDRTGVVVAQQRVEAAARACHRAQAAVGAGQQHAGAEQFAAEHGGIANPLKQFVFGAGAQIASLVALSAANIRAMLLCNIIDVPTDNFAGPQPARRR